MMSLARLLTASIVLPLAACATPSSPTPPAASTTTVGLPQSPAAPVASFPPLSGPFRTFTFDHDLTYRVNDYTRQSRLLLYDTGGFVLQYVSLHGEYRGGYHESNGVITFEWEGWSRAGPWGATGTLNGSSLTMEYNLVMELTDFENAVYRLTP